MPLTPPPDGASAGRTVTVVLELRADTEVIAGTLRGPPGAVREFYGWIELVAGLEALRPPGAASGVAADGAD